jgi:hypothetical protein
MFDVVPSLKSATDQPFVPGRRFSGPGSPNRATSRDRHPTGLILVHRIQQSQLSYLVDQEESAKTCETESFLQKGIPSSELAGTIPAKAPRRL